MLDPTLPTYSDPVMPLLWMISLATDRATDSDRYAACKDALEAQGYVRVPWTKPCGASPC